MFHLPSAQGPSVALEEFRGRSNVVVWFTKGFGCPFCRQQMSQLLRGYPEFRRLNTEILEVTPTDPARGQIYAKHFSLPFPYLCDPRDETRRAYGLAARQRPPQWYLTKLLRKLQSDPLPADDFGPSGRLGTPIGVRSSFRELRRIMADDDTGFFVIDKDGVVRHAKVGAYRDAGGLGQFWRLPTTAEMIEVLQALEADAEKARRV